MAAYVLRRLMQGVVVLFAVSLATFLIFFIVPKFLGGDVAPLFAGRSATPAEVAQTKAKLGLDQPIIVQYWHYMSGIVAGRTFGTGADTVHCAAPCLGYSFLSEQQVWPMLTNAFPITFSLAIGATILWLLLGVGTGVVAAIRRGTGVDRIVMGAALTGASIPVFLSATLGLVVISYKLHLMTGIGYYPFTHNPFLWARNLVVPWFVLAFVSIAIYARTTRAQMLEVLGEEYIRTARAKGLSERTVVSRHALRAAAVPLLTLVGLDFGALIGGAFVVERIFGFPGLGKLTLDAIDSQDIPVVMGAVLFAAGFVVLANLVVDLLYAVADPRVRVAEALA